MAFGIWHLQFSIWHPLAPLAPLRPCQSDIISPFNVYIGRSPDEAVPGGRRAAVCGRVDARAADGHRDIRSRAAAGCRLREVGERMDHPAVLLEPARRSPAGG